MSLRVAAPRRAGTATSALVLTTVRSPASGPPLPARTSDATLTARQQEVLCRCFAEGYYVVPRRVTLQALAHGLGITTATLSIVLRRAEAKIVATYVQGTVAR